MTHPRNVLFIVIDQLRADCLNGALAAHVKLPNLRALMQEAVSFENHYSVTNPCGPSRASLLTGQYAMNHRSVRNGTPLRHDTPNIATEMRKAGYLPMLWGYTDSSQDPRVHHPKDPAVRTYEHPMVGFHEMLEMRLEESLPWQSHLMEQGYRFDRYEDVYKSAPDPDGIRRINSPAIYSAEHSDTAFLTNRFLQQIPAYANQGWFAHLTYIRPHPPLVAPAPYNRMYDPSLLPLPSRMETAEQEAELHPFCAPAQQHARAADFVEGFEDLEIDTAAIQTLRAVYLGLATEVDHHIGRVVQFLKESGQYDNTLLVVTADHGEMLGDHHAWGKQTMFDAAYKVPLIMRLPENEAQAGTKISHPTESIDIVPTILDWVGQEIPNSVDGCSLRPLATGENPRGWRKFSVSELDFANPLSPTVWENQLGTGPSDSCLSILRDERFTLVEFAADLPPLLFDRSSKDGEFTNVATDPQYASELARLCRSLLRHRMQNMDHTLSLDMITNEGPKRILRH